jgi:hypothetical protein
MQDEKMTSIIHLDPSNATRTRAAHVLSSAISSQIMVRSPITSTPMIVSSVDGLFAVMRNAAVFMLGTEDGGTPEICMATTDILNFLDAFIISATRIDHDVEARAAGRDQNAQAKFEGHFLTHVTFI